MDNDKHHLVLMKCFSVTDHGAVYKCSD